MSSLLKCLAACVTTAATGISLAGAPPATAAVHAEPAVPLSTCWSSDAGLPTWGTPVFTPATVDVTDTPVEVTISVPVQDHGGPGPATGVAGVEVQVLGELIHLRPSGGDTWTGRFVVPRRTPAGEHTVEAMAVTDKAGNTRESVGDGVAHPELETPLAVISAPPTPTPKPVPTSLTLSKAKVNVTKKARRVSFRLTVDESAVDVVRATVNFSSRPHREVVLTRTGSRFTGSTMIGRGWHGRYRATVRSVVLHDEYGNVHRTHHRALRQQLGTQPVRIVSRKDKRRPRMVRSKVTPTSIDARTKKRKVTVVVRARDARSGVRSVRARLGPGIETTLRRTKGTRRLGTWRGTVTVGPCDTPDRRGRVFVEVEDRARLSHGSFAARVKVKSTDVTRPRATMPHPRGGARGWPVDGPIRVRFDERVTGVNATSLQVVRLEGRHWSPPLAGSRTCLSPAGATVSCGSRRVTEVRWTPAPGSLAPGEDYVVMLNPDGVLDVRDRSGNPARRLELGFGTVTGPG